MCSQNLWIHLGRRWENAMLRDIRRTPEEVFCQASDLMNKETRGTVSNRRVRKVPLAKHHLKWGCFG